MTPDATGDSPRPHNSGGSPPRPTGSRQDSPPPSAEPALLLVDDRRDNLMALEAVLAPLGQRLLLAQSGADALRHLLIHDVSVIVLDVQMPGLDGFQTAAEIKRRERSRDIPIIFLTAISQDEDHRLQGFGVGAVDYIFKPVSAELLRAKVGVFLELQRKTTALERANAALKHKTAELQRSNADLEQFAYIASHDLKEPLRIVSGYLELLGDRLGDRLDEEARGWLTRGISSCERMAGLLDGLLTYARLGAGAVKREPVDLDQLVDVALEGLTGVGAEPGVVTRHELGTALGSPRDLERVFANVVGNALKFQTDEHPVIDISAARDADTVTVSVTDNGPGVPDDALDRVFGMFERFNGEPYPGTGLGLAISRRVVERSGGRIWMERNPDAGVTVRFTLPAPNPSDA